MVNNETTNRMVISVNIGTFTAYINAKIHNQLSNTDEREARNGQIYGNHLGFIGYNHQYQDAVVAL